MTALAIPPKVEISQLDLYKSLLSVLPKPKDRDALFDLFDTVVKLRDDAVKDPSKTLSVQPKVKGKRPYKTYTFSHPLQNKTHIYLSFLAPKTDADTPLSPDSRNSSPPLTTSRTNTPGLGTLHINSNPASRSTSVRTSTYPESLDEEVDSPHIEIAGANKICRPCYQIKFAGDAIESVRSAAKLSCKYTEKDLEPHHLEVKLAAIQREMDLLKKFRGERDICQLEDGGKYTGKYKAPQNVDVGNNPKNEDSSIKLEKMVMFQTLYFSDLFYTYDKVIAKKTKPERLSLAAPILYRLVSGLSKIHAKEIAHQDIKPENLFLEILGKVGTETIYGTVIGDFGSAQQNNDPTSGLHGTMEYWTPQGFFPNLKTSNAVSTTAEIRKATDIWNAGYIFYLMLFSDFPHWLYVIDARNEVVKIDHLLRHKPVKQKIDEQNIFTENFDAVITEILNLEIEVFGINPAKIVSLSFTENSSKKAEASTIFKMLNSLRTLTALIEQNPELITDEKKSVIRDSIKELPAILELLLKQTWVELDKFPCPLAKDPETFEEVLFYLTWKMLRFKPGERISLDDVMKVLNRFCTPEGLLNDSPPLHT